MFTLFLVLFTLMILNKLGIIYNLHPMESYDAQIVLIAMCIINDFKIISRTIKDTISGNLGQ